MIKKTISALVLFVLLGFLCSSFSPYGSVMIKYSDEDVASNKVTARIAEALTKKYKINAVGFGGSVHESIEKISLSFDCCRTMSVDEYRQLAVECAEDFLSIINSDDELKQYLHHYPFTNKDINLMIFTFDENRDELKIGNFSCVKVKKDKVSFSIRDTEHTVTTAWEESFEDAKRLVYEKQNSRKTL